MKGIVFTEYLEMVEDHFSAEVVDDILDACELDHGGAYTSVGTYNHKEFVDLVIQLSQITSVAVPDLLLNFGQHLFSRFYNRFPQFFEGVTTSFKFLETLDEYIHVEVLKLYPEAELPSFEYEQISASQITMNYRSTRPFADLAEGLLHGCAQHFSEKITIKRTLLTDSILFTLTIDQQ